jgi:hypothetical protein
VPCGIACSSDGADLGCLGFAGYNGETLVVVLEMPLSKATDVLVNTRIFRPNGPTIKALRTSRTHRHPAGTNLPCDRRALSQVRCVRGRHAFGSSRQGLVSCLMSAYHLAPEMPGSFAEGNS